MKKAYTLIEILVVVTIIGLLAAVTTLTYSQLSKQGRDAKRKTDLEQVRAAVEMYRSSNNSYPDFSLNCSSTGGITDSESTYLSSYPKDPKCTTYSYYYYAVDINGNECDGSEVDPCVNYTIGARLETSDASSCVAGHCGSSCNYCLDAYGQK